jgi:hypothetical protein
MTKHFWVRVIVLASLCAHLPAQQNDAGFSKSALQSREYKMHQWRLEYQISLEWQNEGDASGAQIEKRANATLVIDHFAHGVVLDFTGKRGPKARESEHYVNVFLLESPVGYVWTDNASSAIVTHFGFRPETSLVPLILLSGVNPLRFAQENTLAVKQTSQAVHVDFAIGPDARLGAWSERSLKLELSPSHGMAATRVLMLDDRGDTIGEGRIEHFTEQDGTWIPQSVTFWGVRVKVGYSLKQVSRSSSHAPDWLRANTLVSDWRLGFEQPVFYHFTPWSLPSVDELRRLQQEGQPNVPKEKKGGALLPQFVPPFFSSPSVSCGTGG